MHLYLIRHPQPHAAEGLCYGRLDVAVDRESVVRVAQAVRRQIPLQVLRSAPIYTSPLARCGTLARELAAPRAPIEVADLIELNFGDWEGRAWDTLPRLELDHWAHDVWGYRPGGGESAREVAARWDRWRTLLAEAGDSAAIGVTHAGLIRVALAATGQLGAAEAARASIAFGSVHEFELDREAA
jgi:alpha-ribazole phosphatase